MAGIPATNKTLYRRIRFLVGDPVAVVETPVDGRAQSTLILRDIEMERARKKARADRIACPKDFAPAGGLSGDRETATAQAAAECLRRAGVRRVVADRSLPLIFAHLAREAGIEVVCDTEMGVMERRGKDDEELKALRHAQEITEGAMRMACEMVAKAQERADGVLLHGGKPLTAERVRTAVDVWLLERAFANAHTIVAGGPAGADCHNRGEGELRTGEPVIIDIFPCDQETLYNGDCTRTVVHGKVRPELARMHAVVVEAKAAAIAATKAGVTGQAVHEAAIAVIKRRGFAVGLPAEGAPDTYCAMTHGTGHGVGLDVHEPPLLDFGGPPLVAGDVLTIEPGLYCKAIGGVRVEDMVAVTAGGCENFNRLPEGLSWA
ncbi:MAG: aminopeptidase P family protein [Planctomycetia bacterium]|nr:aminopeptidase P family protein [Planctomycetia bacterium]